MSKKIVIPALVGMALIATPAGAETLNQASSATLLADSDMDSIVAGETVEVAQILRTANIIGYLPGTNIPIYRQIDMSGLPDEGAQLMLTGNGPDTNGTFSVEDRPNPFGAPIYSDVSVVGTPSDGRGVAFVTVSRELP